jgi:hypothetical protein
MVGPMYGRLGRPSEHASLIHPEGFGPCKSIFRVIFVRDGCGSL